MTDIATNLLVIGALIVALLGLLALAAFAEFDEEDQ